MDAKHAPCRCPCYRHLSSAARANCLLRADLKPHFVPHYNGIRACSSLSAGQNNLLLVRFEAYLRPHSLRPSPSALLTESELSYPNGRIRRRYDHIRGLRRGGPGEHHPPGRFVPRGPDLLQQRLLRHCMSHSGMSLHDFLRRIDQNFPPGNDQ